MADAPGSSRPPSEEAPRGRRTAITGALLLLVLLVGVGLWRRGHEPAPAGDGGAPVAKKARKHAPPPAWASDPDAPRATIEGRVLDPEGKPVDGAVVAAVPDVDFEDRDQAAEVRPAAITLSASGGVYKLDDVRPGEYAVVATAEGFAPGRHADVTLPPGAALRGIDVTLGKGGVVLSGVVLDTGGGPVPGAELRAVPAGGKIDASQMAVTRAGSDGRYRVALARGGYVVTADADGYAPETAFLRLDADTGHDFRLNPASGVTGRVVERPSRAPVADALVTILNEQNFWFDARDTKTDAQGVFHFKNLDPGEYQFAARKGPLVGRTNKATVLLITSQAEDVVVEVSPGRTISGHVREGSADGAPVGGATLRLGEGFRGGRKTTSAADGSYSFEGVLPGRHRIGVDADKHAPTSKPVAVASEDLHDVDFALQAEAVVTGRVVTKDGKPVAKARVSAFVRPEGVPFGPGMSFGRDETGDDGRFRIDALGPGTLIVSAEHPEHGRGQAAPVALAAGGKQDVTVELEQGAFVSGAVHWDDGEAAAGVTVRGFAMGGGFMGGGGPPAATTDAEGHYRLGPFQKGTVMVQATRKQGMFGFMMGGGASRLDRRSVEIASPEDQKTGVDLTLDRGGQEISGIVVDPDGKPVGGATVGATPEMMGRNMRAFGRFPMGMGGDKNLSGDDGTFTISDLNKGNYTVWADSPGYSEAQQFPVAAGTKGVRLAFKRPATVSGVAVTQVGKPVPDYTIAASLSEGAAKTDEQRTASRFGMPQATAEVHDPGGAFTLTGLDEGAYDLVVTTATGQGGKVQALALAAGEQKTGVKITIVDGVTLKGRVAELDGGAPVVGARVSQMSGAGMRMGPGMDEGATTDAQGAFKLGGVVAGRKTRIMAMADFQTFTPDVKEVNVPEGQAEIDVGVIKLLKRGVMGNRMSPDYGSPGIAPGPAENRTVVEMVTPGSPAAKAGVKAGEAITKVDGRDTTDMGPGAVGALLGGKVGTQVDVEVGGKALKLDRVGSGGF